MVKPSQADRTLEQLAGELFDLVGRFANDAEVASMHSYKMMSRVLSEQCTVIVAGEGETATVKPPKEVRSDSLQNPSDPDAGYSGHKGQGYQAQVMETYIPADEDGRKVPGLSLITHVAVEPP